MDVLASGRIPPYIKGCTLVKEPYRHLLHVFQIERRTLFLIWSVQLVQDGDKWRQVLQVRRVLGSGPIALTAAVRR